MRLFATLITLTSYQLACASPFNPRPFDDILKKRQSASSKSSLQVDLGYSIYAGVNNAIAGINVWRGIRFAAAPVGSLRWQAPQPPPVNRSSVTSASVNGNICPQAGANADFSAGASGGNEDCLFLNVFAPENAQNLPVLVWIHGGGYGLGGAIEDLTDIITTNNKSFIGIAIQYRLGAFGFLSSDEVNRFGVVNAGIRDQTFALQWVQSYVSLFGGDPTKVTISGESAGAGSVMLQTMAYGGTLGTSLFTNAIAASPYLPMQYGYSDFVPSQSYYAFAHAAGCEAVNAFGSPANSTSIFQCLVAQDSAILMNANSVVSGSGMYGTWGFLPVTDGKFIQQLPSKQLQQKQVNGLRILSGNNAEEGALFVPQNITTEQNLVDFIQETFPLFSADNISQVLLYYPGSNSSDTSEDHFATLGYTGPSAINQSALATGQQQRANNIYGETTFVCPSYWLAEAFTDNGREAYKYQYSVVAALHGSDISAYFGLASANQGPDFVRAFMTIWGNFITGDNPSISSAIATGSSNNTNNNEAITNWPAYTNAAPYQINLNQTGGEEFSNAVFAFAGQAINATEYRDPGLMNDFSLVNAWTWEGGRGARCDFWRRMGVLVPE